MPERIIENNQVKLTGVIEEKFEFDHEIAGEKIYKTYLCIERLSGTGDTIPIMISDRLVDVTQDLTGKIVSVFGRVGSYRKFNGSGFSKKIFIFAKDMSFVNENTNNNFVYMEGTVNKKFPMRTTSSGRDISPIIISVSRPYNKNDYIPCIAWGRNARFAEQFEIGTNVKIRGRMQSRERIIKLENGEEEKKILYEISINSIE